MSSHFHLRKYLTEYLTQCNKLQVQAQNIRQTIAANPYFQTVSVFERFDKFRKGYLEPADFSEFMLENQIYPTEAQLYLVFRDFDRYRKGSIVVSEFEAQLLPRQNKRLRKDALLRHPYPVELKLQIDLQFLIAKYLEDKIKSISVLNKVREKIKSFNDSTLETFKYLDTRNCGFIVDIEEVDNFLRNNGKVFSKQELSRIFRVLSFDLNQEISLGIYQQHLDPFGFGCYPAYKQKMIQKQTLQKIYLNKKYELEHLKVHNIVENEQLNYEISQLRESNRRLKQIMDEQDVMNYYERKKWQEYY